VNSKGMADLRRSSHLAHFYSEHRSNRGYPRGISETGNEGADRAVEFDNAKSARGGKGWTPVGILADLVLSGLSRLVEVRSGE
jgi:hypothetical protein